MSFSKLVFPMTVDFCSGGKLLGLFCLPPG